MKKAIELYKTFAAEEDGIALTEYLVLLGLLIGGVIAAVTVAGDNLAEAWASWGGFFTNQVAWDGTVADAPADPNATPQ